MHAPTLGFGHHQRTGKLRLYFSNRIPDYRATWAFLGGVMSDALGLYVNPIYAFFAGAAALGAGVWAVVLETPIPLVTVVGTITAVSTLAATVYGVYLQGKTNRIKVQELEAKNLVIRATAEKEANDQRLAIEEANDKAAYERRKRKEAEHASLYVTQLENLKAEAETLKAEAATLKSQVGHNAEQIKKLRERGTEYLKRYLVEIIADLAEKKALLPVLLEDFSLALPDAEELAAIESAPQTLLIVEDHEDTGQQLAKVLGLLGWKVKLARTCAQAIAALEGPTPPACIVLDLVLPDGQGDDLLRRIRQRGLNTRVVVYSGIPDGPETEAVLGLKPDVFLKKPASFEALKDAVGPPKAITNLTPSQRLTNLESAGVERVTEPGAVPHASHAEAPRVAPPAIHPVVRRIAQVEVAVEDLTVTVEDLKDAVKGAEVDP
jgi:CheY-like chemotaxis protein